MQKHRYDLRKTVSKHLNYEINFVLLIPVPRTKKRTKPFFVRIYLSLVVSAGFVNPFVKCKRNSARCVSAIKTPRNKLRNNFRLIFRPTFDFQLLRSLLYLPKRTFRYLHEKRKKKFTSFFSNIGKRKVKKRNSNPFSYHIGKRNPKRNRKFKSVLNTTENRKTKMKFEFHFSVPLKIGWHYSVHALTNIFVFFFF